MSGVVKLLHLSIEEWSKVIQSAAIVVGGVAAYFKWFKGRLYRPRLELSVSGSIIGQTANHVLVTARAKNLGLCNVRIKQRGTALRAFSELKLGSIKESLSVEWKHEATFPVFENHGWIESNEIMEEQLLVNLAGHPAQVYRLELFVASGKIIWSVSSILTRDGSDL
jgi:hypothetical protein